MVMHAIEVAGGKHRTEHQIELQRRFPTMIEMCKHRLVAVGPEWSYLCMNPNKPAVKVRTNQAERFFSSM